MENEVIDEKLRKNAMRVTGISALRKIRSLVDGFDLQRRKNKKYLLLLLVVSILIVLWAGNHFFNHDRQYQKITTSDLSASDNMSALKQMA